MQNFSRISWGILVSAALLLAGCGNDDTGQTPQPSGGPNLEFVAGSQFVNADQTIPGETEFRTKVNATAGASGNALARYQITVAYDGGNAVTFLDTVISGQTFEYTSEALTRNIAGTEKWTFTVTDAQNKVASKSFTLTTTQVTPISIELNPNSPFISSNTTLVGGTQFQSQILASSNLPDVNLSRFVVTVSYDFAAPITVIDSALAAQSFAFVNSVTSRYIAGTETWTFTATDGNRSASKSFTITTTDPNTGSAINTFESVRLGAQSNATYGSFLDAHTGAVMMPAMASQNAAAIDFVYFYGSSNQATLAAPDDAIFGTGASQINMGPHTWSSRNATRFIKLAGAAVVLFNDATTPAHLQAAFAPASGAASKVNLLATGDVLAFRTADNKYGLALVENIITGPNGRVSLDIKIQQ